MRRSGLGSIAIVGALAWSLGILPGCIGSAPGSGTPSGSGGTGVTTGGATTPSGSGATGGTVVATGGATFTGSGGSGGSGGSVASPSGGATGPTGGAAGGGAGTSTPGGGRGGDGTAATGGANSANGGRAASSGGAGGTGPGADVGIVGDGDYVIAPPYTGREQVMNVPHSTRFQFMMQTSASKVYPGAERPINVYIPKQYVDGTPAPFIIITDGNAPATGSPEILTAAENHYQDTDPATRIPPQVFVFIPPGSNRSQEYDRVSDAYSRFINTEVLPLVESNADIKAMYPNFKLTTNPDGRAAYGCSSGSPAAMGLAWFGNFSRVVSYSGTFVALQATTDHPLGAWEYAAMFLATPPKPLRIFLEVGEMDNGYTDTEASHRNWIFGNRNLAVALKTQGYHYRYLFAMGAGHCDGAVKSKTYSQTLSWVWRGYAP